MRAVVEDHSADFNRLRARAVRKDGLNLGEFSRGLTPRFEVVYRDIALGYLIILASLVASVAALRAGTPFWIVTPLTALMVGYWVAYLMLFIHEGAHWNLAADRGRSDRLSNALIGWWAGMDVVDYRRTHFEHHRSLGTTRDTEFSYFFPIDLRFAAKILLGIRVLEVLASRSAKATVSEGEDRPVGAPEGLLAKLRGKRQALLGAAVHGAIVIGLTLAGFWPVALGWCLGMGLVFPFFGALRQMLEHRSADADPAVDYTQTDHGAVTRLFSDDWIAASFGGAGFSRHLLHHWQPGTSYTRLKELEAFLLETDLGPIIEAQRRSYVGTLIELVRTDAAPRHVAPASGRVG